MSGFMRIVLHVGAGLVLFALVVFHTEPGRLAARLSGIQGRWLALALAMSIAANMASAMRWSAIARALALHAPARRLLFMYARGITLNVLLPGATLSGDVLRSVELSALGNPLPRSALSVFLDRLSGLWVLCGLSLAATAAALLLHQLPAGGAAGWYALALAAALVAPLLPWPVPAHAKAQPLPFAALKRAIGRMLGPLHSARTVLLGSVASSLLVQLLSAIAFWACAEAVHIGLGLAAVTAAAAPIFVMAALPIGIAGFGVREAAAAATLGVLGVPADQAVAAAVLYGACAVIQGLLAAPLFALRR
ncbi:MAG: flippase-like domain-containing protein [Burkholderiales bacterium]|nr:flippase-like domain-containing protein [Burkholderiales bacterium]